MRTSLHVLIVEDNSAQAVLLQTYLQDTALERFSWSCVQRMDEAIAQLERECFDVILLDLTLPDSRGMESIESLARHAPKLPIVVLTNTDDAALSLAAVRHGAQDYLVKRHVTQAILLRSLRYAIERKRIAEALTEANDALERKVSERTAELEATNRRLQREVLARQVVQERLEVAQRAGRIGTFEWDLQTGEAIWSPELEALYGGSPGHLGRSREAWMQTIYPADREHLTRTLEQAIQHDSSLAVEFRIYREDGEIHWVAAKGDIERNALGLATRAIGVHIDITHKKQLEDQLLRSQRLESLGTLSSGIAHDFNNLLTPVLGVAKLLPLQLNNPTQSVVDMLEMLESSAQRGKELVRQILSFASGVEGDRVLLQPEQLLVEIAQMLRQTLPKSIDIQLDIAADLRSIYADETQLHQVLMNLCVNARDAMPHGGQLTISARNRDSSLASDPATAVPHIEISVTDTGIGIPSDILNRVFDPFFTTKEVGKGTGLGLAAVLGIVKSHDGLVDVRSVVGQGCRFEIVLPASQASIAPDKSNSQADLNGCQELILVVDDEETICTIIRSTLEAHHYRVLTASNGAEAIATFHQHQADIAAVLTNLMMPEMDGFAVLSQVRQFNPDIACIAMSGLSTSEAIDRARQSGFSQVLAKPFTPREVLETLARSIEGDAFTA